MTPTQPPHARTHARRPLPRESCRVACVRECRVKRAPLPFSLLPPRMCIRVLVRPTVQKFITRRRGPPVPHPRTRHGDNANFDGLEGSRAPGISITGRRSFPNRANKLWKGLGSVSWLPSIGCILLSVTCVIGGGKDLR